MPEAALVAGDWGTTHLRLLLCAADGAVIDTLNGPGAAELQGSYPATLNSLTTPWTRIHGALPVVLCGMVGSSIGWVQAPYVPCPAHPEQIARACIELQGGRVHIVPGLSCVNALNAPDVMRGEETQILGALQLNPALRRGRHLLCLPGTHTKWVIIEDGAVREFITAPTGELFALLCANSILVSDERKRPDITTVVGGPAFERGLKLNERFPQASLLHRLFECRSRRLFNDLAAEDAMPFLSGILLANDVQGALQLLTGARAESTVYVVGATRLAKLYNLALAAQGRQTQTVDGTEASLNGLLQVHRLLAGRTASSAA